MTEITPSMFSGCTSLESVTPEAWFNNAVSTLRNLGIRNGYEDGTSRPNNSITRAEFAKIAVSFFED